MQHHSETSNAFELTITVGIPTYNRPSYALQTVREVIKQEHPSVLEIIVIDQTHWDNIFENYQNEWLSLIQKNNNIKYISAQIPSLTAARNRILQEAKGNIIVFLDDDVILSPNFFNEHLRCYSISNNNSDKLVIASTGQEYRRLEHVSIHDRNLSLQGKGLVTSPVFNTAQFTYNHPKWLLGANHSVLRSYAIKCGGYDENIKTYGEDVDFTNRLMHKFSNSCTIAYNPDAYILHLRVPTGGCRIGKKLERTEYETIIGYHLIYFRDFYLKDKNILYLLSTLRAGPLRRENVVKPWRQPIAWFAFIKSLFMSILLKGKVKSSFSLT